MRASSSRDPGCHRGAGSWHSSQPSSTRSGTCCSRARATRRTAWSCSCAPSSVRQRPCSSGSCTPAFGPTSIATSARAHITSCCSLTRTTVQSSRWVVYPLARGRDLVSAGAVAFTCATPRQVSVPVVGSGSCSCASRRGAAPCSPSRGSYTVVDEHGVRRTVPPVAYLELMSVFTGLAYAGFVVATRGGGALRAELAGGRSSPSRHLCGLRVRSPQRSSSSAASVAAVRESGVVVAELAVFFANG